MKNDKAKKRAVAAIQKIVTAAKELAKAEVAYYGYRPVRNQKAKSHHNPTIPENRQAAIDETNDILRRAKIIV